MSVTSIHLLYKEAFEPIVRIGENVKLALMESVKFGRVRYVEPIQPQIIDLGPIPAPSTPAEIPKPGSSRELTELNLGDMEFGQWRIVLLDDILLEVNIPAAVGKFITKARKTLVSRASNILSGSHFTEVYTYKDTVPTVVPYNPGFYAVASSRILVHGFRYVFEELDEEPREYTTIPVVGVPTTSK